jgi:hypothetical protein
MAGASVEQRVGSCTVTEADLGAGSAHDVGGRPQVCNGHPGDAQLRKLCKSQRPVIVI